MERTYYYDDIEVATPAEELLELPVDFESATLDYNVIGFEGAECCRSRRIQMHPEKTRVIR